MPPVYVTPSQPLSGYPSQPRYGPPSQPWYGAPQSMPFAGAPPTVPLPRREPFDMRRFLIGGIPLWAGIVALVAVVVTFAIGVFALKKDWADSAWIAAFVALAGAGVILVAGIVILALRRFQWLTLGLSALLLVALSASGIFALTGQSTIHRLQAHALENNQQWQASIGEYWLAGEQAPNASNVARVHLEWGEQLLRQGMYENAINHFGAALEDDTSSTIANRADRDLHQAFTAWLQASPPDDSLRAIAKFLDRYLSNPLCDSDCQQFTRPLAAQAIYMYGEARLNQDRNFYCSEVATDYKDLASRYADTTSGQKAAAALAAPVQFTAYVENLPNPKGLHAWLSRKVSPETHDYITYFSEDYEATLDSLGIARFPAVAPGLYNFSILLPNGFHTYWRFTDVFNPYTTQIGPVCATTDTYRHSS